MPFEMRKRNLALRVRSIASRAESKSLYEQTFAIAAPSRNFHESMSYYTGGPSITKIFRSTLISARSPLWYAVVEDSPKLDIASCINSVNVIMKSDGLSVEPCHIPDRWDLVADLMPCSSFKKRRCLHGGDHSEAV